MPGTAFLIDGFNLYHSLKSASHDAGHGGASTRWLDLRRLCQSYLYALGPQHTLSGVYYFSALATHLEARKPDVTVRHRQYISCLEDSGVTVQLGRFKEKTVRCPACGVATPRYEEKETDVAISAKLVELSVLGQCDAAVLVTGDTDLAPAVRMARQLRPTMALYVLFPYKRHNKELKLLADQTFDIKQQRYRQYQFPDPYVTQDGRQLTKPARW